MNGRARVPLWQGDAAAGRLEALFLRRLEEAPAVRLSRRPTSADAHAARRFWSQRAWSELAALPLLSQALLRMVAEGAPLSELTAVSGILQDEALHTALSVRVAEAFGGYLDRIPEHLAFDPRALAEPQRLPLAAWIVAGGCVGETLSRALLAARLRRTREPSLRAIVRRTLRDESVHVAFAWTCAKRVLPTLSVKKRRELAEIAAPTVDAAFRSLCTLGMSPRARKAERALRERVALAGLGACFPDEEDATVLKTLALDVLPRLRALGVNLRLPR